MLQMIIMNTKLIFINNKCKYFYYNNDDNNKYIYHIEVTFYAVEGIT